MQHAIIWGKQSNFNTMLDNIPIMHPFSPDKKLGKFASAYVTAARSPANTRSLQCLVALSIQGLSSNAIGQSVNQTCTRARPLFDTEKNSLDSDCFDSKLMEAGGTSVWPCLITVQLLLSSSCPTGRSQHETLPNSTGTNCVIGPQSSQSLKSGFVATVV